MSLVGQELGGRYRVIRSLARGGMGQVLEAVDRRGGDARVAVKVLLDVLAQDPTCRERFRREATLAASLIHPCLARVREVSLDSAPAFLVMDLLEGQNLGRVLATEGRIPWRRLVGLVIDVLSALEVVHAAGIIHRDLKPGNVMVVPMPRGERAVLVDLGVAQLTTGAEYQRLTATGAIVGTPAFMSPEQLAGERVSASSDLFSVGVLMHLCLTGERPFPDEDLSELLRSIAAREPTRVEDVAPDVPRAIGNVVRSLLRKRAEERPQSAATVAAQLRDLLEAPSLPRGPSPPRSLGAESVAGLSEVRGLAEAPTREALRVAPEPVAGSGPDEPRAEPARSAPRPIEAPPRGAARANGLVRAAGYGAFALAIVGVLGTTCGLGMAIAWLVPRPTLAAPAVTQAPPPTSATVRIEAHRLDVIVEGPDPAIAYAEPRAQLGVSLRGCLPLAGRALGPVLHEVVWLTPTGAVDRLEPHTMRTSTAEQACIEEALGAARFGPPSTERPIVNVMVNALY
ncbi:MAG: protein kinase [Sandaracinus sp.]